VGSVALQELFNLDEVVLLCEFNRLVPLVEKDAAIDGTLHIAKLDESSDSGCAEAHSLETLSKVFEDRGILRNHFN